MRKFISILFALVVAFSILFLPLASPVAAAPGWSIMSSGTTENLNGVWGSSSSDVFAVGGFGTIVHYDGTSWSEITSPTTENLYSVWGSSSSDVFAVGYAGTIVHYDGTSWSEMTSPTSSILFGVWGSSVFAVGRSGTILHYSVPAVGGTVYPVDKVSILMPWIGLALLLALGAGVVVMRRRQAR